MTTKGIWLAALATALTTSIAHANTNKPDDDSVHLWGPWETLATAAGGREEIRSITFRYDNNSNFTDSINFVAEVDDQTDERFYGVISQQQNIMYLRMMPGTNNRERITSADLSYNNAEIVYNFTGDRGLSDSDSLEYRYNRGTTLFYGDYEAPLEKGEQLAALRIIGPPGIRSCAPAECATITEYEDGNFFRGTTKTTQMAMNNQGIMGDDRQYMPYQNTVTASFIAGNVSSLSAINELQSIQNLARDQILRFNGNMFNSGFVNLRVNISTASWSGDFHTFTKNFGRLEVQNGTISGADLSGSVTGGMYNPQVSGKVEASFFGSQAKTIGGAIEATRPAGEGNSRFVDVFKADLCEGCGDGA